MSEPGANNGHILRRRTFALSRVASIKSFYDYKKEIYASNAKLLGGFSFYTTFGAMFLGGHSYCIPLISGCCYIYNLNRVTNTRIELKKLDMIENDLKAIPDEMFDKLMSTLEDQHEFLKV